MLYAEWSQEGKYGIESGAATGVYRKLIPAIPKFSKFPG